MAVRALAGATGGLVCGGLKLIAELEGDHGSSFASNPRWDIGVGP